MSLDTATDAAIDALAAAALSAANTALADVLDEDPIAEVKKWPVASPGQVGSNALPLLAVSRVSDQEEEETIYDQHERLTVRFAYIAPATPADAIEDRWPIRRAVWSAVIRKLREDATKQRSTNRSDIAEAELFHLPRDGRLA